MFLERRSLYWDKAAIQGRLSRVVRAVSWWRSNWNRADSRFAPSQWETVLLCNDVSHWLGANLESPLWKQLCWGVRCGRKQPADLFLHLIFFIQLSRIVFFPLQLYLRFQGMHPSSGSDQHPVDPHHPAVPGQPAVCLHPAGVLLPSPASLCCLPPRCVLGQD